MRVMVVDDDRALLAAVHRALSKVFKITAYSDVSEALKDLRDGGQYDAVLSDVCMYPVGGEAFREKVREIRPDLAERFVFMSGGADDPSFSEFLSKVRFLPKPFSVDSAVKAIWSAVP